MPTKLPQPIAREDLEKLIKAVKDEREKYRTKRTKTLKPRGKRLNEYLISIILGAHAGMRISEIVGLRPEGSKCCRKPVNEIPSKNKRGNKIKLKECTKCKKTHSSKDIIRLNEGWDIEPLTKDKIKKDRIFINQGKGEKDRYVWKPKMINNEAISYIPLKVSRRSIQKYFEDLAQRVLKEKVHFHQLRHTFATEYLKKHPGDIRGLQVLMGHSRIDTTAIYAQVAVDDLIKRSGEVF